MVRKGGQEMTFDFDMCDGYGCKLRQTCKRYRGYIKADKLEHYPIYLIVHNDNDKSKCRLYLPM